jgi:hypothetical protein
MAEGTGLSDRTKGMIGRCETLKAAHGRGAKPLLHLEGTTQGRVPAVILRWRCEEVEGLGTGVGC